MKKSGCQRDHGCIELKLMVRKTLLENIDRDLAVDLYAGRGRIISSLYQDFQRVCAVEKKKSKCRLLKQGLAREAKARLSVFCMDNLEFIRTVLPGLSGIDMIDMDAYGNPNAAIKALFARWKPEKLTALAITDGARLNFLRGGRIQLEKYYLDQSSRCSQPPACNHEIKAPRLSTGEYELLIRNFWKRLGREHGFDVSEPFFAWKKGKVVLYYGLWIRPAGH